MSEVSQTESGPVSKPRKTSTQPLHAAQLEVALLKLQTLQDLTGLGRTTLYAKEKAGELELVRIGKRCTRCTGKEAQRFMRALGKGEAS